MKHYIIGILLILLLKSVVSVADTLNPCEYMNLNAEKMNQLDTGEDPNFERIKQENNRQMVLSCQQYEIKQLNERTNDWNRDNY